MFSSDKGIWVEDSVRSEPADHTIESCTHGAAIGALDDAVVGHFESGSSDRQQKRVGVLGQAPIKKGELWRGLKLRITAAAVTPEKKVREDGKRSADIGAQTALADYICGESVVSVGYDVLCTLLALHFLNSMSSIPQTAYASDRVIHREIHAFTFRSHLHAPDLC